MWIFFREGEYASQFVLCTLVLFYFMAEGRGQLDIE